MDHIEKTNESNTQKIKMGGSQPIYSIQEYLQILKNNLNQLEERVIKLEAKVHNITIKQKVWYHE